MGATIRPSRWTSMEESRSLSSWGHASPEFLPAVHHVHAFTAVEPTRSPSGTSRWRSLHKAEPGVYTLPVGFARLDLGALMTEKLVPSCDARSRGR